MRISMNYGEILVVLLPDGSQQTFTPCTPLAARVHDIADLEARGIIEKVWKETQQKYFPFATEDLTTDFLYPAMVSLCSGKFIESIKHIKNITGWGLKESKDCADFIRDTLRKLA